MLHSKKLKEKIWTSFDGSNKFHGDISGEKNIPYEDYEGYQVESFFKDKKPSEITLNVLENDYEGDLTACLHFMTPEAAVYFLPTFLVICIDNYIEADTLPDTILYLFSRQNDPDDINEEWFDSFISFMSDKQKKVIREFIIYMKQNYSRDLFDVDFEKAIDNLSR